MLQPKKSKYRRTFRGSMKGKANRGTKVVFGDYGLKAITGGWVNARELEAARKKITFSTKREGKYWIRVFPHKPVTQKAVGVKMGSGKGDIDRHVAVVKPGHVLFEIGGVSEEIAKAALKRAAHKISVKTSIVNKSL
ncbi:MAG: 50S ribosomal protein L16 [Patescibacteria group bacterium]